MTDSLSRKRVSEGAMSLCAKIWGSNVRGKTEVSITNNLEKNQDLKLHCKSADDDLGSKGSELMRLLRLAY
ncbi:hypothetical protein CR513_50119, partial [Mucuna pruriens]